MAAIQGRSRSEPPPAAPTRAASRGPIHCGSVRSQAVGDSSGLLIEEVQRLASTSAAALRAHELARGLSPRADLGSMPRKRRRSASAACKRTVAVDHDDLAIWK